MRALASEPVPQSHQTKVPSPACSGSGPASSLNLSIPPAPSESVAKLLFGKSFFAARSRPGQKTNFETDKPDSFRSTRRRDDLFGFLSQIHSYSLPFPI